MARSPGAAGSAVAPVRPCAPTASGARRLRPSRKAGVPLSAIQVKPGPLANPLPGTFKAAVGAERANRLRSTDCREAAAGTEAVLDEVLGEVPTEAVGPAAVLAAAGRESTSLCAMALRSASVTCRAEASPFRAA